MSNLTLKKMMAAIVVHLVIGGQAAAQASKPAKSFDLWGFGLREISLTETLDLVALPKKNPEDLHNEGILVGEAMLTALANDPRIDLSYCNELKALRPPEIKIKKRAAQVVVLCIPDNTGNKSWNRLTPPVKGDDSLPRYGMVEIFSGQTLRVINFDRGLDPDQQPRNRGVLGFHRLHADPNLCIHQPNMMTPAVVDQKTGKILAVSFYDCMSRRGVEYDSRTDDGKSKMWNHETDAPFFIRARKR